MLTSHQQVFVFISFLKFLFYFAAKYFILFFENFTTKHSYQLPIRVKAAVTQKQFEFDIRSKVWKKNTFSQIE